MRKHYKLDYNNYDISVSATSTELKMTIKFIPFRGVVYMYTYNGKEKEHGKSYVGETVNEKARRRNWKKLDDKYANEKLNEAKRRLGTKDWVYHELEVITDYYDLGMLKPKLFSLEGDYIEKYDTINNGYNVAKYGTGNKGVNFSASHRQKSELLLKAELIQLQPNKRSRQLISVEHNLMLPNRELVKAIQAKTYSRNEESSI